MIIPPGVQGSLPSKYGVVNLGVRIHSFLDCQRSWLCNRPSTSLFPSPGRFVTEVTLAVSCLEGAMTLPVARAQSALPRGANSERDSFCSYRSAELQLESAAGRDVRRLKVLLPGGHPCRPPGPSSSAATGERGAQGQAIGWLILPQGHQGHHFPGTVSVWMKTWELAKDLHTRYGANHLLLGPPRRIALGDSDAALLNAHLWNLVKHMNVSTRYAEGNVLVQPVRSCPPSSCLLMGCGHGHKVESFALMLAAFLEHVHEKATFIHALEQNVRSVNAMMRATKCLLCHAVSHQY
eukprot:scaffold80405_cov69-Phaeocystis_antarctica.AAC.3